MHKLEVRGLKKTIKGTPIIKGISLELYDGEVVGLLGPNGAGKTTTFYMICGLISASSGSILLDEKNINKVPLHKRAKLGIGYLPQWLASADLAAGRLVRLLPEWRFNSITLHAAYPARRHLSAKIRSFIDFLVEKAETVVVD